MKKIKRAQKRLDEFDPRGSFCPICKKEFRYDCDHTIKQAEDRLRHNLMKEMVKKALEHNPDDYPEFEKRG